MEDAGRFCSDGFKDSAERIDASIGGLDVDEYEQDEAEDTVEEHLERGDDAREDGGVGRRYARS